jgi:hypothetical protein
MLTLKELLLKIVDAAIDLEDRIKRLEAKVEELEDHPKEACGCTKCTG